VSENSKRDPLLVSKREAAAALSVSIRTIDNLIATNELPARKLRRRTLIPYSALAALARNGTRCRDSSAAETEDSTHDPR
jgi:excisionase family DNA binding protein